MKLSPRQAKIVGSMIKEELETMQKSLNEVAPDPMLVDQRLISDVLGTRFEDMAETASLNCMHVFRREIYKIISHAMNQHAMSTVRVTDRDLENEVDEAGMGLEDDELECMESIKSALENYAKALASAAVFVAGGADEDR
jgi:hypothetical protein